MDGTEQTQSNADSARRGRLERHSDTITAGALVRRHVRAALDVAGLAWREHKGWTASTFVVSGTSGQMRHARRLIAQIDAGS